MIVREARLEDIPALSEVAARSYRAGFASILEPDVLATRDPAFFAERFSSSWERVLVSERQGEIAGFLLMTDGHIDMLFMDPDASGQGGGARLLEEAESRGARSLECFHDNEGARRFYERHGWRVTRAYERDFAGRRRSFVFYEKSKAS
ncbi:GNAT family N-acetyltransferase [Microvirga guangxiensis]|uniref:Acetyltransferase (GNAT) domain-containing protein n=1 Tax=Microvirga guangxiensis TaxID=549386 RepID=A0A1G5ET72_9HYPH|nr:GNAT family N-acetyltransferase [Microvirga guangxiensis]SCY30182.1 Acetyltransferase (GNAT) domain-containing protein [Microvirga guangxiensis]